ncbi:Type II restriction/modification system, DNA methylase subunit YeeA [Fibrobacter sp. UWCM]|uniref:type IIG restriction enzyme/methyltransferase n=1 Tax=Fibrobacter sp. UWCM TaxID=1896208 RepID=UPI00091BF02B|nr:Eco57I restriction-modification methylase domain-containing protein [Fibrobacter sp. UWCM]SHH62384.1 Type II restriction/modification system, DNA methylase subunit YeeA [Fibrobacter sp. UWCM]
MSIKFISPKKSVNSAFLKLPVPVEKMEDFKLSLKNLYSKRNVAQDEEYHKGEIWNFLRKIFEPDYSVQVNRPIDLCVFNGNTASAKPAVIIEAKSPTNAAEMFSAEHPNVKSLQELVYYFMLEYVHSGNHEIKWLAITNFDEWYFFDVKDFIRYFGNKTKPIYDQFLKFKANQMSGNKTSDFYNEIAKPAIDDFLASCDINVVHFNLEDACKNVIASEAKQSNAACHPERSVSGVEGSKKLLPLFKFLSPETLLAKPFANDSNSLDRNFYAELLHIIGLEEVKEDKGGKKVIQRKKPANRDKASLLESAIYQLEDDFPNKEECEAMALRLCITWVNRLLFLKLVESQILMYQKGDVSYRFMSTDKIANFDELNIFFFKVLGKKIEERDEDVLKRYPNVPYLNSSLFEPTEDEKHLKIRGIPDAQMEIFNKTVLKDERGKRAKGSLPNLDYIFKFLDAYNFASDAQGGVTSTSKTLINASVLGLIFEKINGYKDGSFFTPGFITDYMARDVLERTVVQKFNEKKSWKCENLEDVSDKIEDISEANEIVDDIRVADVAVGSGHFLVSALNRLLAIKSELNILCDADGKRIKRRDLILKVDNDELSVVDDEGEPFEYKPGNEESQRYQEALFNEKRRIIENCLFGVDLNPNSVNICRLRLWIELLKNAYYTKESGYKQLQTLPNIDINIKVGDSLLSKYPVQNGRLIADYLTRDERADRKRDSLKNSLIEYRQLVQEYKTGKSQSSKMMLRHKIASLKSRMVEDGQIEMFDEYKGTAGDTIDFSNSLEWMFEFPEILDDEGRFTGFDAIIGNPPYIHLEDMKKTSEIYGSMGGKASPVYTTYNKRGDIYCLFVERAMSLLKENGFASYIMQNKWMQASYGKELREFFLNVRLEKLIDFGDIQVFDDATTYPCIFVAQKAAPATELTASTLKELERSDFAKSIDQFAEKFALEHLSSDTWTLSSQWESDLLRRLDNEMITLGKYVGGEAYRGVLTGLTKAFLIDENTKKKIIEEDKNAEQVIHPFLQGRDVKTYEVPSVNHYLILFPKGFSSKFFVKDVIARETKQSKCNLNEDDMWKLLENSFPSITRWLAPFAEAGKKRGDKGDYWWELRACDYYDEFAKPKIMYQKFQVKPCFVYDDHGLYCNDSMWIIPTEDKALLALLNSKMAWWLMKKKCTQIQNGVQLIWQYLSKIPVPRELPQELATLADQIITAKKNGEDTTELETQVNTLVYQLYGITDTEEIEAVEKR